jgi:hypothetical protein
MSNELALVRRQCTAIRRNGERCKKAPILGHHVCQTHGGGAPQVKRKAWETLQAGANPAAVLLNRVVDDLYRRSCPHCHRLPSVDPMPAIRAAVAVLDRAGYGPHAKLEVRQEVGQNETNVLPWVPTDRLQQMNEWQREHLERLQVMQEWLIEAEQRMKEGALKEGRSGRDQPAGEIVEGYVLLPEADIGGESL